MDTETQTLADRVIDVLGGREQARKAFDITREGLRLWRSKGIPAKRAVQVEEKTGGKVKAEEVMREVLRKARA